MIQKTSAGSICDQTETQKYQNDKKSLPEGQGHFKTEKSRVDITDLTQTGSRQYALQNKSSLNLNNFTMRSPCPKGKDPLIPTNQALTSLTYLKQEVSNMPFKIKDQSIIPDSHNDLTPQTSSQPDQNRQTCQMV